MKNAHTEDARGLAWLEDQVHYELDVLRHNYQPWVPPALDGCGKPVLDVLIVGGGLYGSGLAWGLRRSKVTNILVVDQAATLSIGPMFGGLNGIKFVLERLVDEICRAWMMENLEIVYDTFEKGLRAPKPPGAMGATD